MLLVIFLPGGVMEGVRRLGALRKKRVPGASVRALTPAGSGATTGD
jgi:hypothetical protein